MKKLITLLALAFIVCIGNTYAQESEKMEEMPEKKSEKEMMKMKEDKMEMKDNMKMDKNDNHKMGMVKNSIKDWPENTQKAAEKTMEAYGTPDGVTDNELIWYDAGTWEMIRLSKEETKHVFPVAHTDYLEQTIFHKVPVDKMDELGEFDGSVTFDRTQGYFSARCDLEANNFLALNLAHDIINDEKTVEEARKAYADIIKQKMNGEDPDYMKKLQFEVETMAAADPDVNTTGLTKKEVMKAIKENKKM